MDKIILQLRKQTNILEVSNHHFQQWILNCIHQIRIRSGKVNCIVGRALLIRTLFYYQRVDRKMIVRYIISNHSNSSNNFIMIYWLIIVKVVSKSRIVF